LSVISLFTINVLLTRTSKQSDKNAFTKEGFIQVLFCRI